MPNDQVLTPGGLRPRALVHEVQPGTSLNLTDGLLRNVHPSGEVLAAFETVAPPEPDQPLMPNNVVSPDPVVPAYGDGWITYAAWTNDTGTPVSSFATDWIVPDDPPNDSGQTLFLFNGIQNSGAIYQPVLQWGPSAAGGGNYWAVASWYVGPPDSFAFHSSLIQVSVGQSLRGVMTLTGVADSGFSYNCEFIGIADANLPIQNIEQLNWCCQTLEAYRITGPLDYPRAFPTAMTTIDLATGTTNPALSWSVNNKVTDTGQHTVIVDNSSTGGEVDIYYRGDVLPGDPVAQGQWASIRSGHVLTTMADGRVLDWVPDDGTWRLWNYDAAETADVFPGAPVSVGLWTSIQTGHALIRMADGRVLDWVPDDGTWRLWNYVI